MVIKTFINLIVLLFLQKDEIDVINIIRNTELWQD